MTEEHKQLLKKYNDLKKKMRESKAPHVYISSLQALKKQLDESKKKQGIFFLLS